tara:strand:+ start:31789 stop:32130 length:342 start_codon:yes stop_codon:yes gene_type:complete
MRQHKPHGIEQTQQQKETFQMTKMTKTKARAIARHLNGPLYVAARGDGTGAGRGGDPSKTWGYKAAIRANAFQILGNSDYRTAQTHRRERMSEMVESLMDGTAPDWMNMDFKW